VPAILENSAKDFQPAASRRKEGTLIEEGKHAVHSKEQNSLDFPVSQTEYTAVAIGGGETGTIRVWRRIASHRPWWAGCDFIVRARTRCESSQLVDADRLAVNSRLNWPPAIVPFSVSPLSVALYWIFRELPLGPVRSSVQDMVLPETVAS
jgi:hypothetical protein